MWYTRHRKALLLFSVLYVCRHGAHATCGYESCPESSPDPSTLNIHIVAHTHDDVGWLKTVDQYFYGANQSIQNAGVQYILDSVVSAIEHDPRKRFIYVESAFFQRWYSQQADYVRHKVSKLVKSGQLEFIGGGWSMNDEAAAHYSPIIDQMTWGHRYLIDNFGSCGRPRVAWQIDPFGHSREQASIFAQAGFDGLFFGRGHFRDKGKREVIRELEMLWHGSDSLGTTSDLFTGWLFNNYSPPPGFCFDLLCGEEPIMDDPRLEGYNVKIKVDQFLKYCRAQASHYKTNNVLITMGNDFNYQAANTWFKNLDKLIKHVNTQDKVRAFYSTPSCYLNALNNASIEWPSYTSDFFPYASDPHAYWTGFFTSRPTSKFYERLSNNLLQVVKQLATLTTASRTKPLSFDLLREAQAIMQHHDAVTGTERQHVANDYALRLSKGWNQAESSASVALGEIVTISETAEKPNFTVCSQLNISACDVTEKSAQLVVTVYNPLPRQADKVVRLPVVHDGVYYVFNHKGEAVTSQIVPLPEDILEIPGRVSQALFELVFIADDLPPIGAHSYFVTRHPDTTLISHPVLRRQFQEPQEAVKSEENVHVKGEDVTVGYEDYKLVFDGSSHLLSKIVTPTADFPVKHEMLYYNAHAGNNTQADFRASGAYIFRPDGVEAHSFDQDINITTYQGPIVTEVHQKFSDWVSVIVRTYKGIPRTEFQWLVGPIPIGDSTGKEVISRFTTSLENEGEFITDSNGRQNMYRKRGAGTFGLPPNLQSKEEPISSNYYPVTARIEIADKQGRHVAVLTDRAEGGSSLVDGQMELMVHRRLLCDDAFGVSEPLNETAFGTGLVVRGTHTLLLGDSSSWKPGNQRLVQQETYLSPWLFFTPVTMSFNDWRKQYRTEWSALKSSLDPAINLLTLEPWKGGSVLLRLENLLEKGDGNSGRTASVDLQNMFDPTVLKLGKARETSLLANQWLDDVKRLKWNTTGSNTESRDDLSAYNDTVVKLVPMQIRTFIVGSADTIRNDVN